jgi:ribosomal protein S18 acetylase RimI-like enzyme
MPRDATRDDAPTIARLLYAFNREYDDPTPEPGPLAERVRALLDGGDTRIALADDDAGVAVLRFRPSLWTTALECYLAELYVIPERRGQGLGRALLGHALDVARAAGADRIDLGTSEDDVAARALYERMGFTNREGLPDGPTMYVYEREL